MLPRDARIVRGLGRAPRPHSPRQLQSRRGKITAFSDKARARFHWHIRNLLSLTHALTLTYHGLPPIDDAVTKRHLRAIERWIVGKGCGVVWKQEFCKSGRPHLHLMTTGHIAAKEVAVKWAGIVGCKVTPQLVRAGKIRDRNALQWYLAKSRIDGSNRVPVGYQNMGRWWGYRGPGTKVEALATIEGAEAEVAKVARLVKLAQKAKLGQKGKRDNGVTSRKVYDGSGEVMARDAARYGESLGLDVFRRPLEEPEGEP